MEKMAKKTMRRHTPGKRKENETQDVDLQPSAGAVSDSREVSEDRGGKMSAIESREGAESHKRDTGHMGKRASMKTASWK